MDTQADRWCGAPSWDELGYVVVGDPDPTPDLNPDHGERACGFEWAEDPMGSLVLPWYCTRTPGHPGKHIAGTGDWVVAIHTETPAVQVPRSLPTLTRT